MMAQHSNPPDEFGSKRAADEYKQKSTKPKRSRYVNKACNECKRRKLKCDGEESCERCLSQNVNCTYAATLPQDTVEWSLSDLQRISTEIQTMRGNLDQVMKKLTPTSASDNDRSDVTTSSQLVSAGNLPTIVLPSPISEDASQPPSIESSPQRGPTSSGFAFEVARERLQTLGLDSIEADSLSRKDELGFTTFSPYRTLDLSNIGSLLERDPLCQMDPQEVSRLIDVWSHGIGKMFPVTDCKKLHARWELLRTMMTSARPPASKQYLTTIEALHDGETHLLRLVLANSLTAGSGGMNETAKQLFESTGGAPQAAFMEVPTLRNINMLMLVGILYYHLDDEMRANRVISLAVRLCLELGLHRKETFQRSIRDQNDQTAAVATFWSVYVLERRSSIGLGVPFIMQDSDIDDSLPRPTKHLYLEAMIDFTRLAGQVCRRTSTLRDRSLPFPVDEIEYQDYKILQWQKQLCSDLTLNMDWLQRGQEPHLQLSASPSVYVAIVLHARAQQLRSLIYRPVLYSASRMAENKMHAHTAVEVARESVQFLALASRTTTLAMDEPLFFRDFLISHLAGILLAVSNGPIELSHQLGEEFYLVLSILRNLSSRSPAIARVWNSIKILEIAGPKLGLARPSHYMPSSDLDTGGNDCRPIPQSQDDEGAISAGNQPLVPMNSMWPALQQDLSGTIFDGRDLTFSTSMFPTQLRNELSLMNESLSDIVPNLFTHSFTDDSNSHTWWQ